MALLSYRATPFPWCRLSPAGLLMGHHIRSDVPQLKEEFVPRWEHSFRELENLLKKFQKSGYDKCHYVKDLPTLPDQLPVWVDTQGTQHLVRSLRERTYSDLMLWNLPGVRYAVIDAIFVRDLNTLRIDPKM